MELKDFFTNSSNETYNRNMDLLEHYNLVNPLGSPNKMFLEFLKSKDCNIKRQPLTRELIEEFEESLESTNLREAKIRKEKEMIFNQRKVWISLGEDDGCDLILKPDEILIEKTGVTIPYTEMIGIEIEDGGWSKKRFIIFTKDDEISFEINENRAVPLKEILEDNISHKNYDEISQLMELYEKFEAGEITPEEFELKKAIIYSDDVYCTNCGFKLDADSDFCSNCGHRVSE
ncbi:zinc-ribbon domain-containing protein [Methanobrevibacter sp.]|uniref:zinc ribbon domain-containing protein n=1 Tax=Methanobrevibacter sp. TaxID=66852 RepID=UPI00386342C4